MLMINDGEGPVAIAGVMGGLNSEISLSTKRVLIESAYFQPASVRRTSRKLGLSTEASYRFERGADWENTVPAIARTCYLIEQARRRAHRRQPAGCLPEKDGARAHHAASGSHRVVAGSGIDGETLSNQHSSVSVSSLKSAGRHAWEVTCPTCRADMELEADLIEELARFYGYQNIPAILPPEQNRRNAFPGLCPGEFHSEHSGRPGLFGSVEPQLRLRSRSHGISSAGRGPCRGQKSAYRGHSIYAHHAGAGSGAIGKAELQLRPAPDPAL